MNFENSTCVNGLTREITIKDLSYGVIEFTMTQTYTDAEGKVSPESSHTTFYTKKELKELFQPVCDHLRTHYV